MMKARTERNVLIIDVSERLDTSTSAEFDKLLATAASEDVINNHEAVVVNLSRVDYISSAGLRVIVALGKRTDRQGRKFMLAEMQKKVAFVFELSGLDAIFKIFETEQEALDQIET